MNFGEIKAFLGDKPQQNPNVAVKQQLQEEGLKQAAEGITLPSNSADKKLTASLSSQTTVGLRVYNNSLEKTIEVDNKKTKLPTPDDKAKSLFDFEKVAENVLRFVSGVITNAAAKGADESTLNSLFEQARSGVSKGIALAEKDLAGFLNEEITEGISRSANSIEIGIQNLETKLIGDSTTADPSQSITDIAQQTTSSSENSGELLIRTKDGDEVRIRFENLETFQISQKQQQDRAFTQPIELTPELQNSESIFVAQNTFSFSVSGELDAQELESIGNLVKDASALTKEFFDGDIETAFNQALDLGFNKQELVGFALQLTRQQQVDVVNAYETVSLYNEESKQRPIDAASVAEPISDYLDKLLNVLEQSSQKLPDGNEYENLVNGLVNEVQDIGTTELLSAINKFNSFNQQLLSNLPAQQQ